MRALVLGLLLSAVTLGAADVSGKWSGTFEAKGEEKSQSRPAFMVLKQDGDKLTGSGGPNESEQHEIRNGKVEGEKLTFEIPIGEGVVYFDLKANGDQIEGDIKGQGNDGNTRRAKISLKRVAEK